MNIFTKSITLFLFLILSSLQVQAQQTGLFHTTIQFKGETRNMAMYVPSNYNAENSYDLVVCLHGMGDNSTNYGNNLFQYWSQLFTNTIFLCPDGGSDPSRDYYAPVGDQEIITTTMDYVKNTYNINEDEIILQGFSLGGRSAFKYGLDHPELFKGLLLNTPAFQGVNDANNNVPVSLGYKLQNATDLPIVFVCGSEDGYVGIIQIMYDNLIDLDGIVYYETVQGMAHSIPPNNFTEKFVNFINDPTPKQYDMEMTALELPDVVNESTIIPIVKMRNVGSEEITSVKIRLTNDENNTFQDYDWEGSLLPFQHVDVELPVTDILTDLNKMTAHIEVLNSDISDEVFSNDDAKSSVIYQTDAFQMPTFQGGEPGNPEDTYWTLQPSGHTFSWYVESAIKKSGDYSILMFNTPFYFNNVGIAESFTSPFIDLTSDDDPALTFDIAHNYLTYGPPNNITFMDTLEIYITVDHGASWDLIYKKFGSDLATADNPLKDQMSMGDCIFYPNSNEWRNEVLDLSDYKDATAAQIRFTLISGMGGTTSLDNIIFQSKDPSSVFDEKSLVSIYPNPASKNITIESDKFIETVVIYNLLGEIVYEGTPNDSSIDINVSGFSAGTYFVRMNADGVDYNEILIVE